MPELFLESYNVQADDWPDTGRHILAQYDDDTVVVYQAFNKNIARFAVDEQALYPAPGFKLDRMTWIKPSFLWMMHRSQWATAHNQERVLAIWFDRVGFDAVLRKAVLSTFDTRVYADKDHWRQAVGASSVRVQWDPDYTPTDGRLERRAIQIGLGGKSAKHYANGGWVHDIQDITDFVHAQQANAIKPYTDLLVPRQRVYPVYDDDIQFKLGM